MNLSKMDLPMDLFTLLSCVFFPNPASPLKYVFI